LNANDLAAQFIATVTWESLPELVQEKVRMCLVDSLGAMLAGTLARISQIGAEYAAITWPGDQATILLHAKRASAIGAAFANGCAANAIDVDDSARYAYGHAGAQIFTTALAVAEARGLSGAQLLTGMVVGYEVAHRVPGLRLLGLGCLRGGRGAPDGVIARTDLACLGHRRIPRPQSANDARY
jgi:2-methylcitrate dehydratase PrpD